MPKFEIGDTVQITKIGFFSNTEAAKCVCDNKLYLKDAKVTSYYQGLNQYRISVKLVDGDSITYSICVPESWLELVEKKKPELYNGKVICVKAEPGSAKIFNFTAGKVYEIVNGTLYNDRPCCCKKFTDNIKSFQHLQKLTGAFHSGSVEFIEFKGFAGEIKEG